MIRMTDKLEHKRSVKAYFSTGHVVHTEVSATATLAEIKAYFLNNVYNISHLIKGRGKQARCVHVEFA